MSHIVSLFFNHYHFLTVLLLAVVVHRRKSDDLYKDTDDIRENIINYEDEGGGEGDMTGYDLNVLRLQYDGDNYSLPHDKSPQSNHVQRRGQYYHPTRQNLIHSLRLGYNLMGYLILQMMFQTFVVSLTERNKQLMPILKQIHLMMFVTTPMRVMGTPLVHCPLLHQVSERIAFTIIL